MTAIALKPTAAVATLAVAVMEEVVVAVAEVADDKKKEILAAEKIKENVRSQSFSCILLRWRSKKMGITFLVFVSQ